MPGFRLLHGIHGEGPDSVRHVAMCSGLCGHQMLSP
jgi:hypothetical protein